MLYYYSFTPRSPTINMKVWVDGCFDMFHYGHANALRQARHLGTHLTVGVHTDADILTHKGPCLMTQSERYYAVSQCRFVDEVAEGAPYVTSVKVMREHGCQVCVHGDDVVTGVDGGDVYAQVKEAGMYVEVKRTPAVSTTNLLQRMLSDSNSITCTSTTAITTNIGGTIDMQKICEFAIDCHLQPPPPLSRIVYIDGTFDLVHVGHLAALQEAKRLGDYLLVGVHDDRDVMEHAKKVPIMSMEERVLSLLACKHVDNVVIGAPYAITADFIHKHRISMIVVGHVFEYKPNSLDCYAVPRQLGLLHTLAPHAFSFVTVESILRRVVERRDEYVRRNAVKGQKDAAMRARGLV